MTGVCSAANRELVACLGVEWVIDHTTEDFNAAAAADHVIVDCVANAPFERAAHLLRWGRCCS